MNIERNPLRSSHHLPIQATSRSADIRTELRPDDLIGCFFVEKTAHDLNLLEWFSMETQPGQLQNRAHDANVTEKIHIYIYIPSGNLT